MTIKPILAIVLWGLSMTASASDCPAPDLSGVLQRYYAAVRAGDVAAALALCTRANRAAIEKELTKAKRKKQEKEEIAAWQAMTPDDFTVEHCDTRAKTGEAQLHIVGSRKLPPEAGARAGRAEMAIAFRRENNGWRVHHSLVIGDPDQVKRSADLRNEPLDAFDIRRETTMEGRVVRAAFDKDYTLVVLRVLDEEIATFHPSRKELEGYGFDFRLIEPWRRVVVNGHPHKSNGLKLWVNGLRPN